WGNPDSDLNYGLGCPAVGVGAFGKFAEKGENAGRSSGVASCYFFPKIVKYSRAGNSVDVEDGGLRLEVDR
ncbi:MAG: hypothetical protein ACK6D4_00775, partial [Planctomyces sp.]